MVAVAVLKKPGEPGETEYSHGKGLMAPIERGHIPTQADQLHALFRNDQDPNSVTGNAEPNYNDVIRETGPAGSDKS